VNWNFIDSDPETGNYNMDLDMFLADTCQPGEAFFRLYQWNPYCISLGAGQDFSSVNTRKAQAEGIDIVKRPTGGRAVLHAEEITYSVIIPVDGFTSAKDLYFKINSSLSTGLKFYNPLLSALEMEQKQINFNEFYKTPAGAVCFAAPSKNELKFSGKKIVGSAQRKMNKVILQHGSILCGSYHKRITEYLSSSEKDLVEINNELDNKTIDIESVTNSRVDYRLLREKLAEGFEYYFNIKLNRLETGNILPNKALV
jgi:lipoyl(octanoyl) transferase